jgi:hypothetical protein
MDACDILQLQPWSPDRGQSRLRGENNSFRINSVVLFWSTISRFFGASSAIVKAILVVRASHFQNISPASPSRTILAFNPFPSQYLAPNGTKEPQAASQPNTHHTILYIQFLCHWYLGICADLSNTKRPPKPLLLPIQTCILSSHI